MRHVTTVQVLTLLLAMTLTATTGQRCPPPILTSPNTASAGLFDASFVCSGYFNLDPLPDYVTAGSTAARGSPPYLHLHAGPGLGIAQPLTPPPATAYHTGLACGDLTLEGLTDLVTITLGETRVYISDGSSTPLAAAPLVVDSHPVTSFYERNADIALADVNGDTRVDIVLATLSGVRIIGNTSPSPVAPSFAPAVVLVDGYSAPKAAVALGDLNGDGILDIMYGRFWELNVFFGGGGGVFAPSVGLKSLLGPGLKSQFVSVVPAKLNGPSEPLSLVFSNADGVGVIANSDNTIGGMTHALVLPGISPPDSTAVAVGNLFSATSAPDIVVADFRSDTVYIIANEGNYSFGVPEAVTREAFGVRQVILAPMLVSEPGIPQRTTHLDVVFVLQARSTLSWIYGFILDPFSPIPIASQLYEPRQLNLNDYNADGRLDVLITHDTSTDAVSNIAQGAFGPRIPVGLPAGSTDLDIMAMADLDADGQVDIVGVDASGRLLWILGSLAVVPFPAANAHSLDPAAFGSQRPLDVVVLDWSADTYLDLVVSSDSGMYVLPSAGRAAAANPAALFDPSTAFTLIAAAQGCVRLTVVSAVDGTILGVCPGPTPITSVITTVSLLPGRPPSAAEFTTATAPWTNASFAYLIDPELDGSFDIVLTNATTIGMFAHNDSAPSQQLVFDWLAGPYQTLDGFDTLENAPVELEILDFQGSQFADQYPDILPRAVVDFGTGSRIAVWLQSRGPAIVPGAPKFDLEYLLTAVSVPHTLALADLTQDGYPDSLYASTTGVNTVFISTALVAQSTLPTKYFDVDIESCGFTVNCLFQMLAASATCGRDVIQLRPGVYTGCPTSVPYTLDKSVTIRGLGATARDTLIDCEGKGSFLRVSTLFADPPLSVTLENIAISGMAPLSNSEVGAVGLQASGEAVTLVLRNVVIANSSSIPAPNAVTQPNQGMGGALLVSGGASLHATDVVFEANTAGVSGGGLAVIGSSFDISLTRVSFDDNTAAAGDGGAVFISALGGVPSSASMAFLSFSHNTASIGSGGCLAINAAPLTELDLGLTDLTAASNTAPNGAGGTVFAVGRSLVVNITRADLAASTARFGGVWAAVHSADVIPPFVGAPTPGLALGAADPIDTNPAAGGVFILDAVAITAASARYGGLGLVCGGLSTLRTTAAGATGSATTGGGVVFACLLPAAGSAAAWSPGAPPVWFDPSGSVGPVSGTVVRGYGDAYATPGATLEWEDDTTGPAVSSFAAPLSVVTGVPLIENTAVVLRDLYGGAVVDELEIIALERAGVAGSDGSQLATSGLLLEGNDVRASLGQGQASLDGTVVTASNDAYIGALVELTVSPDANPIASLSMWLRLSACPPGYGRRDDGTNALRCALCSQGTYSDAEASLTPCLPCDDGGFADYTVGATSCLTCPPNAGRDGASSTGATVNTTDSLIPPCACLDGFFAPSRELDSECVACPVGGVCPGGVHPPQAAAGYFPSPSSDGVFLECSVPSSCAGGLPFRCARGYTGRLCSACANSYYALGNRCYKCDEARTTILVLLVLAVGIAVLTALLVFNLRKSTAYKFAAVMIGLNSLQISAMYGQLDLPWGDVARAWFEITSLVNINLDLTSPECSASRSVDIWLLKWWLIILMPVFFAVGLACLAAATWLVAGVFPAIQVTSSEILDAAKRAHFQSVVLAYLPLVATSLSVFGCRREADGSWTLAVEPSRKCFTTAYWTQFPFALIFGLIYTLGIPIGLVMLLRSLSRTTSLVQLHLRYGFLVARFIDSWASWEAVIMARKAGVVLATTLFFSVEAKANAALLVLLGSLVHLLLARPYRSLFHNSLAMTALGSCCMILQAGTVQSSLLRGILVGIGIIANSAVILAGTVTDFVLIWQREKLASMAFFSMTTLVQENAGDAADRDARMFADVHLDLGSHDAPSVPMTAHISDSPMSSHLVTPAGLDSLGPPPSV